MGKERLKRFREDSTILSMTLEKVSLLYSFNEQALCEILTANKSKLEKPLEGVENL